MTGKQAKTIECWWRSNLLRILIKKDETMSRIGKNQLQFQQE